MYGYTEKYDRFMFHIARKQLEITICNAQYTSVNEACYWLGKLYASILYLHMIFRERPQNKGLEGMKNAADLSVLKETTIFDCFSLEFV